MIFDVQKVGLGCKQLVIKFKCSNCANTRKKRHAHLAELTPFSDNIECTITSLELIKSNARIAFEFHNKKATTIDWITLTMTAVKLRNPPAEYAVSMCVARKKTVQMSTIALTALALTMFFWSFAIDATVCQHTKQSNLLKRKQNKTNLICIIQFGRMFKFIPHAFSILTHRTLEYTNYNTHGIFHAYNFV